MCLQVHLHGQMRRQADTLLQHLEQAQIHPSSHPRTTGRTSFLSAALHQAINAAACCGKLLALYSGIVVDLAL